MSDPILDIESGIDKIEAIIRTLRDDRDNAREEVASLKRVLDDRELELLQKEEELEQKTSRYENQIAEAKKAEEDMEMRLADVAAKVKNLLPLVADYLSGTSVTSSEDRT
jgi:chromosome segregation ATPase